MRILGGANQGAPVFLALTASLLVVTDALALSSAQTLTVVDNDNPPTLSFSAAAQSVAEGNGGGSTPVSVTVSPSVPSGKTITVPYTIGGGGTATNPADHNAANGTLTVQPGEPSAAITFSVVADAAFEPNETVILTLGTPTNATLASPSSHTVTILNDEAGGSDSVPNQFQFAAYDEVPRNTTQYSNVITITGIDTTATVTVTGGYYSQNGGAYTTSAGTAYPGDTFQVRHVSAGTYMTARHTTLTVGGVAGTFTTVTMEYVGCFANCP